MESLIKPVTMLTREELKAIGGFIPSDVMDAAKKNPNMIYVMWSKGKEPVFFPRVSDDDENPLIIIDGKYEN